MREKTFILILLVASVLGNANKPIQQSAYAMRAQYKTLQPAQQANQVNLINEDFYLDMEISQVNNNSYTAENISAGHAYTSRVYYLSHFVITNLDRPPPAA